MNVENLFHLRKRLQGVQRKESRAAPHRQNPNRPRSIVEARQTLADSGPFVAGGQMLSRREQSIVHRETHHARHSTVGHVYLTAKPLSDSVNLFGIQHLIVGREEL